MPTVKEALSSRLQPGVVEELIGYFRIVYYRLLRRPRKKLSESCPDGLKYPWIGTLLRDLGLIWRKPPVSNVDRVRKELDDSRMLAKLKAISQLINAEAGVSILHATEFLGASRVRNYSFEKERIQYLMEIVLRSNGPAVVFRSAPIHHGGG